MIFITTPTSALHFTTVLVELFIYTYYDGLRLFNFTELTPRITHDDQSKDDDLLIQLR
jgi:hypothetical protein